jgi:hypothetical protein
VTAQWFFGSIISAMVGWFRVLVLLVVAMSAQEIQGPKIKILFPEGHCEKASMAYAMHLPGGGYYYHFGMSMPSGDSSFEIPAATDRFKALVWAPGCKMKEFDVAVEKADLELKFVCDPLKTIAFSGRVKSVNIGGSTTISANYTALGTCARMNTSKESDIHCGGPQIVGIATAKVAADGSFKIELPDFSADPIVSGDPTAEIEFHLDPSTLATRLLRPESSSSPQFAVAPSYPAEVSLVPVEWRSFPGKLQ